MAHSRQSLSRPYSGQSKRSKGIIMPHALTLVASDTPLSAGHLAKVEGFIGTHGLSLIDDPVWLNPHKAVDFKISDCLNKSQMDELRQELNQNHIDVFCTALAGRRKKLLCADMESTIIKNEMLEELAEELGLRDTIAEITQRSMNGEIDFTQSLIERVAMLKDLSETKLTDSLPTLKINTGAKTLVQTMKKFGTTCVLVTGGFTFFSDYIAKKIGFDHHHANILDIQGGKLTGKLASEVLDPDSKLRFLEQYCQTLGIQTSETLALGDGANDLPMLTKAGLGAGYYPKPALKDVLMNQILHTDFTSVLYAQGYNISDFIE